MCIPTAIASDRVPKRTSAREQLGTAQQVLEHLVPVLPRTVVGPEVADERLREWTLSGHPTFLKADMALNDPLSGAATFSGLHKAQPKAIDPEASLKHREALTER